MKTGSLLLAASAIFLLASPVFSIEGSPKWLSDQELLAQFDDATIEGRYGSGRHFTERYIHGGRVAYTETAYSLGGHWSVTEGTLCTIYDEQPTGGCYRVSRVDENCFEFYFVSRTEADAPGSDGTMPMWTARGAIQGKPSACRDEPSV